MNVHTSILLLSIFALHVTLATSRPSSDPDYSKANATALKTNPPYARYDTATVYIHAFDNITKQEWISTYWPRVDEFSQLTVLGSYQKGLSFNSNLTISVELRGFNQTLTPKRVYSADLNDLVIPYFTAVALLDKGNVTDFQWDDGCSSYCNPDKDCLDDQCGNHRFSGSKDVCTEVDCNIKVYFAWSGRDKNDVSCKSMASVPSNFRQVSVAPITSFGNGLWDDFIYKFTTNAPNPITGESNN